MNFYVHFNLAMDRSPGFGSTSCNFSPYSDSLSLRLRSSQILTSLHNVTRRSVLQKVHGRAFNALPLLVNTGSFHLSLTVLCAIGHQVVFSLGGWSPLLPARFLVPCGTLDTAMLSTLRLRGFYSLWRNFPVLFCSSLRSLTLSTTPRSKLLGLGYFPFARRYLGNRCFFLFLPVLRCFSSRSSLSPDYLIHQGVTGHYPSRVSPFRNPRIKARLQLPLAYRSWPRLSSALGAIGIHPVLLFA